MRQTIRPILVLYSLIITYWFLFPVGSTNQKLEAAALLVAMSIISWRVRNNTPSFITALFVLYVDYSICLTFYLAPNRFNFALTDALNEETLGIGVRLLWIMSIALLGLPRERINYNKTLPSASGILFWTLIASLLYIMVFEFDRTVMSGYSVRISPLYEYSYLIVLIAFIAADRRQARVYLLVAVSAAIMIQDAAFGGRATSAQILIVLAITVFASWLSASRIISLGILALSASAVIGATRSTWSSQNLAIMSEVSAFFGQDLLVNDTASHAYYASLTHLAAAAEAPPGERYATFVEFLAQVVLGGRQSLSSYVSENYYVNVGGGVYPSSYYFWGGLVGSLIGCMLIAILLSRYGTAQSPISTMVFLALVSSTPRWLLYSPAALLRPVLLLLVVVSVARVLHLIPPQGGARGANVLPGMHISEA